MFTNLLGIRLLLLIGKFVPEPAAAEVMNAISKIEVTNDTDGHDGFQITFSLTKQLVDYGLLTDGTFEIGNRVTIGALLGIVPEVLINGIITHQQVAPSNEPGGSMLTITGGDVSVLLDLEEKNQKFENQPDFIIFNRVLAKYATVSLVPNAAPTVDVPLALERIPRQQETDLQFIKRLASRNGFVFYIEPISVGVSTAYFGPENRLTIPQAALSVNMGAATNVDSLSFSQDGLAPITAAGSVLEPISKTLLPLPAARSLKVPLAVSPTPAWRTSLLRKVANQNPAQAASTAAAAVTNAPDAITGQGQLDVVRYGSVLRARRLVGVRGAGYSYDGNYFVRRVSHHLARGSFTQSFTLSREGTGALLPVVQI